MKNRNRLFPDENLKEVFENQKIIKPDLVNSLRFASEENTPTESPGVRGSLFEFRPDPFIMV